MQEDEPGIQDLLAVLLMFNFELASVNCVFKRVHIRAQTKGAEYPPKWAIKVSKQVELHPI